MAPIPERQQLVLVIPSLVSHPLLSDGGHSSRVKATVLERTEERTGGGRAVLRPLFRAGLDRLPSSASLLVCNSMTLA
jgi:hypothetical protein